MKTQIAGVLLILTGLAAVVLGIWGFTSTETMTALPTTQPFDAQHWSFHWKVSSSLIVTFGLALGVAGSALLGRKRWGFMLLSSAAAVAALLPWLLVIVGFNQYVFEQPRVLESLVLPAIGVAAFVGYRRSGGYGAKT